MPKICKHTLICLEKKRINSFALLVHKHPQHFCFIFHPPTPNNRYNNALIIKSFEITDNSKAATLKKNNSLCTEECGLPWNTWGMLISITVYYNQLQEARLDRPGYCTADNTGS